MVIKQIKPFLVDPGAGKNWLFVKIETDEGIVGWGECYTQLDRDGAILKHIEELSRYLIGRDPFNIKHICYVAYIDFAKKRGSMDFYAALSGLEQAMWDIVGKALNVPVYKLMGGKCREKVRVYANGWYYDAKTDEQVARRAQEIVKKGFTALKFDPFSGPWRSYVTPKEEAAAVRRVQAVREAVGPDIDLLIEMHRRLSPYNAIRVAHALEPFNPFWFEEPVDCENLAAFEQVRRNTGLALVTGEALYTKYDFVEVFERRLADIINPDVCNCGGILELKEIASMAEPHFVNVAPHNYNSTTMALAATVQVSACIPNFLITEYFVVFEQTGAAVVDRPLDLRDGYIYLDDTRAGLGLNLVEAELVKRPFRQFPVRSIREYHQEN